MHLRFLLMSVVLCAARCPSVGAQAPEGWIPVIIDTAVATHAKACIIERNTGPGDPNGPERYFNTIDGGYYENGRMRDTPEFMRVMRFPFNSSYSWVGDTLVLEGGAGWTGGIGFTIRVHQGQAQVRHLVDGHARPLGYTPADSLRGRLEVPCTRAHLVLEQVPDITFRGPIFGYVQFLSEPYYADAGEYPRVPTFADLQMYFRCMPRPVQ